IRRLYEGTYDEVAPPEAEEVKEVPITTIDGHSLADQDLMANGIAYLLEYGVMLKKHGEESAQNLVMGTVHQAMLVIRRHARSEVRAASFTVWVAQQEATLAVIIAPALYDLFEVVHTSEEETNPFSRFLLPLPEIVETRDVSPLQLGAYPNLRYEAG
ncbi:hypothetical protein MXD81_09040, partial [Microbacteriaceae bacterium K1510]|nr:hypothetical protein [Microbacteriaceae bacterium K1510]